MKKIIYAASLLIFGNSAYSQTCSPSDSTIMGSGSANDIFYSLKKGVNSGGGAVKTISNTNWHLAFSVMSANFPNNAANGVAIRVNSPNGENAQTGSTGCALVKLPGASFSNWNSIDTTGLYALPEILDNDSTWNLSAFTSGYPSSDPFDFIWGTYNMTNHKVTGTSIYVLYNKTQDWYKKIFINEVDYDTLWRFTIANIDNTDSNTIDINKKDHPNRNFIYYDVLNNSVLDREPDNRTWDLVWTKYKTMLPFGQIMVPYTVTGVLQNVGVTVAQNNGKKCSEVWLANKTAMPSDNISTIGYDWKTFNGSTYDITDTFVYFINALDTHTYKMTMISYTGGATAKSVISFYESTLGLNDLNIQSIGVYPNPVNAVLTVQTDAEVESITLMDMFGKEVKRIKASSTIDMSELNSGIYMVFVKTDAGVFQQRVIKQ